MSTRENIRLIARAPLLIITVIGVVSKQAVLKYSSSV